jgi:aspartyl-tRNA synthetase
MIAGLDKYYQIARCFRDEDLRADRQPEFSQLDIEMSFATPDQIYRLVEGLFASIFHLIGVELQIPFPRFTFAEVMRRFGSDKPDLRIQGMELQDLSATLAETTFAPYASILSAGGQIKGMVVGGGASMSRKTLDELQEFAKRYGAGALAWIKLGDELSSSLLKALGHDMVVDLAGVAGAQKGDAVLIVAGKPAVVAASLGALRNEVARREKLIPEGVFAPLWVTEFPMFEYHEDDDRYYSMHHPFTSPLDEDVTVLEHAVNGKPELFGELRAKAYDAGHQRRRSCGRLDQNSPARCAGAGVQGAGHVGRECPRAIRVFSGRAGLRDSAARRHCVGDRADADGPGADRKYSRRDGLSQDCVGAGFNDRRTRRSRSEAVG